MQAAKVIQHKIIAIFVVTFCIMGAIMGRLFQLQIKQTSTLYTQGQKNFLRLEKTLSPRGNILDVNGTLLATNRPLTNLTWRGTGNRKLNQEQIDALTVVEKILGKPLHTDPHQHSLITKAERQYKQLILASDINYEQLSQIKEQLPLHANLILSTHFMRFYPYKSYASHILGYLGQFNVEPEGKMGLEKVLEETLKGESGLILKKINSFGRNLAETELKRSLAGTNITTTLDIRMQELLEELYPEDRTGTFIIMDPANGNIVALLSRPTFEPSLFLNPIPTDEWSALQEKHPFINRAFSGSYPPGSLFKLVSISAALEKGLITAESTWYCSGAVTFAGRLYHCHNRMGHGELTIRDAVANSCNTLFYNIGKHISIDTLAEYAQRFGLGQKTNVIFPEKEGLIPTNQWKRAVKGERWWPGETLSATIGQSFLQVTPIQIACMISSIFTGYLVKPRILVDEPVVKKPLRIQPTTLDLLRKSMRLVVTKGTGRTGGTQDIEIYAKTSTAQISDYSKREQFLEHGGFAGYISYKHHRPLTFVIWVEKAGSSQVAKDIARHFFVEYKKLMDQESANS